MDTAGDKIWPVSMHLYHAMVQSDNKMWLVCVCSFYVPWFEQLLIVASNDINEDTIHSLNHQVHTSPSLASSTKTRYTHSTIRYTPPSLASSLSLASSTSTGQLLGEIMDRSEMRIKFGKCQEVKCRKISGNNGEKLMSCERFICRSSAVESVVIVV